MATPQQMSSQVTHHSHLAQGTSPSLVESQATEAMLETEVQVSPPTALAELEAQAEWAEPQLEHFTEDS